LPRIRRRRKREFVRQPGDMHTIESFCESNRISISTYYSLRRQGKGPRETRVSERRITISPEAEADWRREREAATRPHQNSTGGHVERSGQH
jgi:hypothetical protein